MEEQMAFPSILCIHVNVSTCSAAVLDIYKINNSGSCQQSVIEMITLVW